MVCGSRRTKQGYCGYKINLDPSLKDCSLNILEAPMSVAPVGLELSCRPRKEQLEALPVDLKSKIQRPKAHCTRARPEFCQALKVAFDFNQRKIKGRAGSLK